MAPLNHPFTDGFSITSQLLGIPHLWKSSYLVTQQYHGMKCWSIFHGQLLVIDHDGGGNSMTNGEEVNVKLSDKSWLRDQYSGAATQFMGDYQNIPELTFGYL